MVRVHQLAPVLAVLALAYAGAGAAYADPGIGGRLDSGPGFARFVSASSMPVLVSFSGERVTASPASAIVAPGGVVTVALIGPAEGHLYALLTPVSQAAGSERSAVTLALVLKPYVPPFDWAPVGIGALIAGALVLALRRWRPWQLRLSRP